MEDLLERIRYTLNLPLTATPDDIVGHLEKLIGLINAAGGPAGATPDVALSAVLAAGSMKIADLTQRLALPPDPAKYCPVTDLAAVQLELSEMKAAALKAAVDRLIETGIAEGRLLPAQTSWARELGLLSFGMLQQHIESVPRLDALRGTQTGGRPPGGLQSPIDKDDPMALARAALAYQTAQAEIGAPISIIEAVNHVTAMSQH